MGELIFERTCNYWIDAGIVGFYDTLNKPLPSSEKIGEWQTTIKKYAGIKTDLQPDRLVLIGDDHQIDLALSYALENVRTTLYDVSSEKQIDSIVENGYLKQMSTPAGELLTTGKPAGKKGETTWFHKEINEKIGKEKIFLPLKSEKADPAKVCIFCGRENNYKLFLNKANDFFSGETKKVSPFVEGQESNRCFHSSFVGSEKCWKCGYLSYFAPLLLFYRKQAGGNDTYYALPHLPGNLKVTYQLFRSLSGKRGLALVIGADHTSKNYESIFSIVPKGIPCFILSFYYDLFQRLIPKSGKTASLASESMGLVDPYGNIFQTALFLKRDSGQKSFILREITIERSAYFIKLFSFLSTQLGDNSSDKLKVGLTSLIRRASNSENHLQRISVIRACQAFTEGKHAYRFLLPIIVSSLKEEPSSAYEIGQISQMFLKYDQWLFNVEDKKMAETIVKARNEGQNLSEKIWKLPDYDDDEKRNLIKRYYYTIERSPSPVKFLEQARHAYMKAGKEIPTDMSFHKDDGTEDVRKFEAYRVYFLSGMLNGLLRADKKKDTLESDNGVNLS